MIPDLPEQDAEFLTTTIDSVLKGIRTTVNGQFISSGDNGQYYLDLDRVIDYEAKVDERIDRLSEELLDRHYFQILAQVMERPANTYVPGYRIWEYEVEWAGHRVTRPGYLFFGGPNDRSTAQPPRTFYIYFLGVFDQKPFDDKRQDDEVILRLARPDEDFLQTIKRYASAQEWAANSSGDEKLQYQSLAERQFKGAAKWLVENLARAFDITHEGKSQTMAEALAGDRPTVGGSSTRDAVDSVASAVLAGSFDRRWPTYPQFLRLTAAVTEDSRPQAASEALRYIGGTLKTAQGSAVLDGLKLLQGDLIRTDASPYAKHALKVLADKPDGHVVNRDELLRRVDGVDRDPQFGLESDWMAVVLIALAYRGEVQLSVNGSSIDATNVAVAASLGAPAVANFGSYQRPKGLPMAALRRLLEMLGVNDKLLEADADRAAVELQSAVVREIPIALDVGRLVKATRIWESDVWSPQEAEALVADAADYKTFLDRLTSMTNGAKLRNLKESADEIDAYAKRRDRVREASSRIDSLTPLGAAADYLATAITVLSDEDPIVGRIREAQPLALSAAQTGTGLAEALQHLATLQSEYVRHYLGLHAKARLGPHEDERAKALRDSSAMRRLDALGNVEVLPVAQLTQLKQSLAALRPCWAADDQELSDKPYCGRCMFRPALEAASADSEMRLRDIGEALESLAVDWSAFLQQNLTDPVAKGGLDLLNEDDRQAAHNAVSGDPVPAPHAIQALNKIFGGLQKVSLPAADLIDALRKGGPSTRDELQERLDVYVADRLGVTEPSKARIVIE